MVALAACRSSAPSGAIGARWGDPIDEVARRLHITCDMQSTGDFAECTGGPIDALSRRPVVTLVGDGGRLAGIALTFLGDDCHRTELQKTIADQFHVDYSPGDDASPYTVFADGELVY